MKDARDFWTACYTYIESCNCNEFRRTARCGCRSKRGKFKGTNPCLRNQHVMDDILLLSVGNAPEHGNGVREIVEYISRYTCNAYRTGHCNHRKCNEATDLLNWLTKRKAA